MNGLGFLNKVRIPLTYAKSYLKDYDTVSSRFDYDTVKEIWKKYI